MFYQSDTLIYLRLKTCMSTYLENAGEAKTNQWPCLVPIIQIHILKNKAAMSICTVSKTWGSVIDL